MLPLTILDIVGVDAARVANNLCTAPILNLVDGQAHEAFFTDVRGKTLGHVCVYRMVDRLRLIGPPGQTAALAGHFDRYTIREDAAVVDQSESLAAILIPTSAITRLDTTFASRPPANPHDLPWQFITAASDHGSMIDKVMVCRVPWVAGDWSLLVAEAAAISSIRQRLADAGVQLPDAVEFHSMRVANRFPWFGVDVDDKNLPQEADRDAAAISFTKGCYLGQETVARLDALGQVQKKLVLWRIDSPAPPPVGAELTSDDKVVGRLTSVVAGDQPGQYLAIGYARRSHFSPGASATHAGGTAVVV
jgi:folate-binding protein YgfZ